MVWSVCQRVLRNTPDAEDAFQGTFLVLARKARSIRKPELLGNWLYGVGMGRTSLKAKSLAASRRVVEGKVVAKLETDTLPDPSSAGLEVGPFRKLFFFGGNGNFNRLLSPAFESRKGLRQSGANPLFVLPVARASKGFNGCASVPSNLRAGCKSDSQASACAPASAGLTW